jgi:hypothetical protein
VAALTDRRTTPRWLQLPALLFLVLLVAYFGTANRWALDTKGAPKWIIQNPAYTWFGGWKMFTDYDPDAARVDAEVMTGGVWQPIDLEALFPTIWESGPRYARTWFRKSPSAMRVLAQSTCGRAASLHPERVRFTVTIWRKRLGELAKPTKDAKTSEILDWDCSKKVPLPKGRRI